MLVKAKGDLQAVSANRLRDGIAVWLSADHRWVEDVAAAGAFSGRALAEAQAVAQADSAAGLVVDVYPLDVAVTDGRTRPLHVRERMKARGPSVRPDLGKQADTPASPRAPERAA
ncbi:DUF2849 domain-containing protein [Rhodocista pekingensis]|uniref:DUF2849 domain-containing protein n=1 Tax=Rhodocista pekingensis TaxID=201185 RepID=A0ABW2KUS0_9PROT